MRSARGRWWDRNHPAGPCACWAFQAYKRNALGLTVQVHGFGDEASPAAFRTVVRTHSGPPSLLSSIFHDFQAERTTSRFVLRITNKKASERRERKREKRTTPIFLETEQILLSLLKCMRESGRTRSACSTRIESPTWKARATGGKAWPFRSPEPNGEADPAIFGYFSSRLAVFFSKLLS